MEFAREASQHVVLRYTAISFPLSLSFLSINTRFFLAHISINSSLSLLDSPHYLNFSIDIA